jgi:hypothetical protein
MLRTPSKAQLPLRLFAIVMSAGFFFYLIWRTGPGKLWKILSDLGWWIILVIALAGVPHLARTGGWRLTLGNDQHKVSFARLVGLRLGAEAAGQLGILGQTVGDSVRVSRMSAEIPVASGGGAWGPASLEKIAKSVFVPPMSPEINTARSPSALL